MPTCVAALLLTLTLPTSDPVGETPAPASVATAPAVAEAPPIGFLEAWLAGTSATVDAEPPAHSAGALPPTAAAGEPMDLGDGLTLELGGEERLRWQSENNRAFGNTLPRGNDFTLNRLRLHADLKSDTGWRAFVEAIDARIWGMERRPIAIDRNHADIRNAFVEYEMGDTAVRVGRTDLLYGAQRLISPLDWGNTRRTFEGVVLEQDMESYTIDAFVTKPVVVDFNDFDHDDDSLYFSGVYTTFDVDETTGLDAYGLALNETTSGKFFAGDTGRPGTRDVYTLGLRAWTKDADLDAETEFARQFGQRAGDTIRAYMFTARAGYTFAESTWAPRVGFNYDYASGDDDPTDGTLGTFNQLFPLGHAYNGYLDLVGRQNIHDLEFDLTLQFDDRTTFKLAHHFFRLDERTDFLYNAGGAPVLQDVTGAAGRNVGTEWDLTLTRDTTDEIAFIDRILVGYSYFDPRRFVSSQTSNDETRLMYIQATKVF
jgi:hypothetical protein